MSKFMELVAGKLWIEIVKSKNLDLVKKKNPELHISLESRAKNVTDLEKKCENRTWIVKIRLHTHNENK